MYVSKVLLKDIRGFSDLSFDLTRPDGSYAGWTVFTGDNGSGKSTLLKAIAIALTGKDTARALQPSFHRWIRDGQDEAAVELGIFPVADDDTFTEGGRVTEKTFLARIAFKNGLKEPQVEPALPTGITRKTTLHHNARSGHKMPKGGSRAAMGHFAVSLVLLLKLCARWLRLRPNGL
ncbi:AAA family ATPase [Pseudomonas aeruginosa]|nr:AAA family ATPase [Pseudomonas aeruginosa]MDF5965585.1 AAA family ATPase [Pseudomonas aeruginosa]MDF5976337.1 AAA family ATPase [Pseudomonas aeruginosa]